jgi:hypothetical protein
MVKRPAAAEWHRGLLRFRQVGGEGATALLSTIGRPPQHIAITKRSGARRKPPRTTGLYQVAIRCPIRLVAQRWPFLGFANVW